MEVIIRIDEGFFVELLGSIELIVRFIDSREDERTQSSKHRPGKQIRMHH